MVFAAAIATLLLYFIRPQDWVPGLEGVNVVKPVIAMAVFGLMSRIVAIRPQVPYPSSRRLTSG